ncbi:MULTISPECIES: MraY family glycosyltransferase [Brucella/Ochrobactrum group]|jgi:UDP-GlcNAc:undecaprenyl-phosphate GlcNAc-1-phosphate transferase|uniref:Undecaprenyl/decaprenyl-phosphate alpha-N-acetylglucosaminyl 1-phosphate transferase n=1 Tax=Brucella pseudintermedia TaxID=370111 RepID=A0ABY5UJS7_9HYPH|nr:MULTISPECIES: MraY family glycosyltransferase [Brucella/Ochrobactrum group]KAB2681257.1 undecaprenyl/decaprenyl-phosphate alpha-N-acetylglucosaminyl 1-phosphate transferase [Brucella pseudintermedia]MCO7727963.1 undecaprenyl/decaprenyl-phosphate alpha-N-acetylglucosaminyl 1-phosphate transferase [Brucella intermedia]NKE75166.1 undecaprenyl/decaprenyl-phosphate alpha-N-acetylglucosaminyl 1-phosphate transferase [Ochrobactrum sp. MC-1LL]TWH04438.1 UDP-GlcNAc:undecaprenyl-phosphate GlcNAc-1-pho
MTSLSWITLLAFALSVAFCLGFRELAREWYLIDVPDARKTHDGNVPLCGGIAIFLSFSAAALLTLGVSGHANAVTLLPGLVLILVTGVLDDRFNLPVAPRLAIQLLAAFLMLGMAGVWQIYLGLAADAIAAPAAASGDTLLQLLSGPLFLLVALAFIVGLVNAVNMSDGVDGLAGSASAAAFFWLAVIGFGVGEHRLGLQGLALAAACLGFLVFNMRHRWRAKASLFLGDGGSTFLGAALAGFILILAGGTTAIPFPVLIWIVIVPVIDTLSLIVRRVSARRSPFSPDRQHLHHLLMDAGLSCGQTAVTIMVLNLMAGAVAFVAVRLDMAVWPMLLALAIPAAAHTLFVLHMTRGPRRTVAVSKTEAKPKITYPGATS